MAYVTARTWVTSEVITAALLNEQIRDNMRMLYEMSDVRYDVDWAPQAMVGYGSTSGLVTDDPTSVYVTPFPGYFEIDGSGFLLFNEDVAGAATASFTIKAAIGAGSAVTIGATGIMTGRTNENWQMFTLNCYLLVSTVSTVTFSAEHTGNSTTMIEIGVEVHRRFYRLTSG